MASLMLERALPRDLANRSQIIETKGKIEDFGRLVEVIETDLARLGDDGNLRKWRQNPVDIRLRFGWADSWPGIPALQGELSTMVAAVCQRCLEPFRRPG